MKTAIVIDFDNTIGYFKQIVYLLNIIEKIHQKKYDQNDIDNLLKLYPNVLRPKINDIFLLVDEMKGKNKIDYFGLYTTNKNKKFVNMIIDFIERNIYSGKSALFDFKIFSPKKDNPVETLSQERLIKNNRPITICFIDNKKLNTNHKYENIISILIKCDSYKYIYDIREIGKSFDYCYYKHITKKIITKYLTHIYNGVNLTNLPYQLIEMNSNHLLQVVSDFCYLHRC